MLCYQKTGSRKFSVLSFGIPKIYAMVRCIEDSSSQDASDFLIDRKFVSMKGIKLQIILPKLSSISKHCFKAFRTNVRFLLYDRDRQFSN